MDLHHVDAPEGYEARLLPDGGVWRVEMRPESGTWVTIAQIAPMPHVSAVSAAGLAVAKATPRRRGDPPLIIDPMTGMQVVAPLPRGYRRQRVESFLGSNIRITEIWTGSGWLEL